MAKSKKNETKTQNEALMSLPITNSPRGMSILAQKISAVLGKPITVEAQGATWLKLVGMEQGDHETLFEVAPNVCGELDAITIWTKGKDESIMAYVQGRGMRDDIRAKRGLTVDPESRIVTVDLAMYLGNAATRAAEKAQKAAERAAKPKKVNTKDALTQMLGILTEMKSDLDTTKAELATLKASKPAKGMA